jgi:hypothetical protein
MMPSKKAKEPREQDSFMNLRLPYELRSRLEELAAKENRSLSNFVRVSLMKYLKLDK